MPYGLQTLVCSLLIVSGVAAHGGADATATLRSSAETGDLQAMRELAESLLNSVDSDEGVYWLERASVGGDPESMHRLASLRFAGARTYRDQREAVTLWKAAAVLGLGHKHARESEFAQRVPDRPIVGAIRFAQFADAFDRNLLCEKTTQGLFEQLLFFRDSEIHVVS